MIMKRYCGFLFFIFALLVASGCGHPSAELVFNTSTEAYPVSTDNSGAALAALGSTAIGATSLVRIEMQGIGEAKMQSVWLQALSLEAREGNLKFIQLSKCFLVPKSGASKDPLQVGLAKAEDVSADGKTMKFHVDSGPDLAGIVKSPFSIIIEIEGDAPVEKTSVSGDLTFKARLVL